MSIGNHNVLAPRMRGQRPTGLACGERPTEPKGPLFVTALAFAQLTLFIALLGPVMVSMALKVSTLTEDPTARTSIVGSVLGIGALAAVIGNAVFGRLSDRTTSRFGRRRPWLIGGTLVMAAALLVISQATTPEMLMIGWFVAQLGANAAISPFVATLADQLPEKQYASVSATIGVMQNVGILAATWFASLFATDMLLLFMAPAAVGVVGMVIYVMVLPDPVLTVRPAKLTAKELIQSFWVNPVKHSDYGFAWWSRFLIFLSSFMFTSFRLPFIVDRLHLEAAQAASAVFMGVLVYTVALVPASYIAGWLSDRTGHRKLPVALATVLFAVGTYLLVHVETVGQFYLVEALLGIAFGIYASVDMALVLEVLPNANSTAKDLGVFNMANAAPQSLAPFAGAWLLTVGAAAAPNYGLLLGAAAAAALAGALVILPIKGVR
ncbi:MFS transporter [Arthrobacter sp. AK04]|uniref:MFS transporter n=1 Tax=Arthrobacter sp. AK04 TaxID=2900048 RepID=UPI001E5A64A7|nr:MFS transporter [Arthrobacter sp. AK04]MCD5341052.1 MFS transporter [Arthrobacter sp. AK04]